LRRGEAYFRRIEAEFIGAAIKDAGSVLSLGGAHSSGKATAEFVAGKHGGLLSVGPTRSAGRGGCNRARNASCWATPGIDLQQTVRTSSIGAVPTTACPLPRGDRFAPPEEVAKWFDDARGV